MTETETITTEQEYVQFVKDRLADPDRVVLNPDHLYETEGGSLAMYPSSGEPARACFIGWMLVADERSAPGVGTRATEVVESTLSVGGFTATLRNGEAVSSLDRALRKLERRAVL